MLALFAPFMLHSWWHFDLYPVTTVIGCCYLVTFWCWCCVLLRKWFHKCVLCSTVVWFAVGDVCVITRFSMCAASLDICLISLFISLLGSVDVNQNHIFRRQCSVFHTLNCVALKPEHSISCPYDYIHMSFATIVAFVALCIERVVSTPSSIALEERCWLCRCSQCESVHR